MRAGARHDHAADPEAMTRVRAARIRFVVGFGVVCLGLVALHLFPCPDRSPPPRPIGFHFRTRARAAGSGLTCLDPAVHVDGVPTSVRLPHRIVRSCDTGEAMALLVAAIVAFPAAWRFPLVGLAAGGAPGLVLGALRWVGRASSRSRPSGTPALPSASTHP
jgi:hypothetical protein